MSEVSNRALRSRNSDLPDEVRVGVKASRFVRGLRLVTCKAQGMQEPLDDPETVAVLSLRPLCPA